MEIVYLIGLFLSMAVGMWHFTVPYLYKWYSYIPEAPIEIIRSIDWINYFFSLFLTGISIILIVFKNKIFKKNKELLVFYGFFVFVWLNRVIITILLPMNYNAMFIGQLIAFTIIFIIQLIPLLYLIKKCSGV